MGGRHPPPLSRTTTGPYFFFFLAAFFFAMEFSPPFVLRLLSRLRPVSRGQPRSVRGGYFRFPFFTAFFFVPFFTAFFFFTERLTSSRAPVRTRA